MGREEGKRVVEAGHARVNILGVGISAINQQYALDQIDAWNLSANI